MFKQHIYELQLILVNFTLPNNADIPDDNLIKEKDEEEMNRRMDILGQNGNEGLHYKIY